VEWLVERAITFAIAEADEGLAVVRLAFLARGCHVVLDAAMDTAATAAVPDGVENTTRLSPGHTRDAGLRPPTYLARLERNARTR
jgi:hypothetical protein